MEVEIADQESRLGYRGALIRFATPHGSRSAPATRGDKGSSFVFSGLLCAHSRIAPLVEEILTRNGISSLNMLYIPETFLPVNIVWLPHDPT